MQWLHLQNKYSLVLVHWTRHKHTKSDQNNKQNSLQSLFISILQKSHNLNLNDLMNKTTVMNLNYTEDDWTCIHLTNNYTILFQRPMEHVYGVVCGTNSTRNKLAI